MSLLRPLDPSFPIERQIAIEAGPVVLVNVFTLDKADEQTFLKIWQDDAAFMKRQPGFISTQLHRALGESPTYLNYAVWESTLTSGLHSAIRSSEPNCRVIRPRPSLPHTCSRRSRCPTSASHSSRRRCALAHLEPPSSIPGRSDLANWGEEKGGSASSPRDPSKTSSEA